MTLMRLYAWSCAIVLPVILGCGALYLYLDDHIGLATIAALIFTLVAVAVTAATLRDTSFDHGDQARSARPH